MTSSKKGIYLTVIGICFWMILMVGLLVWKQLRPVELNKQQLREAGVFIFDKPRLIEPFSLINQEGQAFTKEELKGHWTLVFFGFTFCPDICPTTLAFLNKAVAGLEDEAIRQNTRVMLASVDPARDTPEQLKQYLAYFNPAFIGLTGEFIDVFKFASNLNAPFQKVPGEQGEYTVDHSAYIFILNPMGDYHGFIKPPFSMDTFPVYYQSATKIK